MLTIILILALLIMVPLWAGAYLKNRTYDGVIVMTQQEGKTIFMLELDMDPDLIVEKDVIRFKVIVGAPEDPQE